MDWLKGRYMRVIKIANIVREMQKNPASAILFLKHHDFAVQMVAESYVKNKRVLSKDMQSLIDVIFDVEKEALEALDKLD